MGDAIVIDRVRKVALDYIKSFAGTPYLWGGDDPSGFDCSGLAVEFCKAGGALPRKGDLSSRGLFRSFSDHAVSRPYPGCLVFYSSKSDPERINHVEICLDRHFALGASGGGSKTVSLEDAARMNAYVKVRPIVRDRPIVGYVDPFLAALWV